MPAKENYIQNYYSQDGNYLRDHRSFFKASNIKNDINFLINTLHLKKKDLVLDIACGQGRHANALAHRGYAVDGVDFSAFLLNKAKKEAKKIMCRKPDYYLANISNLRLKKKYNKAYWFFSDLANIDLPKTLTSIGRNMKKGGMLLIDTDNIFRIAFFLFKHKTSKFSFDAIKLELIDNKTGLCIPYPVFPI